MKIILKSLKGLENKYIKNLVDILNTDRKLIKEIGRGKELLSRDKFVADNKQWSEKNKAQIFAIIMHRNAIGLISLSRINKKTKNANIGYWIASKHWNKGYVSEAFKQILNLAKENNLNLVSCSIPKENRASIAIWQKFNAKLKKRRNSIIPQIYL